MLEEISVEIRKVLVPPDLSVVPERTVSCVECETVNCVVCELDTTRGGMR